MSTSNALTKKDLEVVIGKLINNRDEEIQELLARPYIVEQGTSGDWTYRKWSDGTAECWGDKTITVGNVSAWGTLYYSAYTAITFPQNLFIDTPTINYTRIGGIEGWLASTGRTKDGINAVYLMRPTTTDVSSYYIVAVNAIGKWK